MSLQIEKLEHNMAKLTITVPADEMKKAATAAYNKQKSKISVPGFRKGKVPQAMVEKMYGKGVFLEEAANSVIPSAYEKAVAECEEEIVSAPTIDVVELAPDKDFVFTAEVALKPSVELGKYKGVKIDKVDVEVTEEDVNAAIDRERRNNGREITIEDRPVKEGDKTTIDFEGFNDGVPFEGGKGTDYPLEIGSGAFIPGFEEQVVGMNIGEEKEINVTFPEDYHAEELAGKPVVFKVKVNAIKETQLPELDDEFASEVSEYETVAEYKEAVKKGLVEDKENKAKDEREKLAIEAVIADAKMDIPEAMITTTQRQMVDEFAQRIMSQGMNFDQYMQLTGMTQEMMLEQVRPQAEMRIKSRLVLEKVVEAEKIEVTEEDLAAELERVAKMYQMELDQVKEMIGEAGKEEIKKDLAVTKAADFVRENAKESK